MNALLAIQCELKVPKSQFNKFGNFRYRSCEDILEAVKPILKKYDAVLTINDDLHQLRERVFIRASAMLKVSSETYTVNAFAEIDKDKKGMDAAQITGSASSYARKYALCGLLLIDDGQDNDAQEPPAPQTQPQTLPSAYGTQTAPPLPPPPPIQRPAAPAVMPPPPPPPPTR